MGGMNEERSDVEMIIKRDDDLSRGEELARSRSVISYIIYNYIGIWS